MALDLSPAEFQRLADGVTHLAADYLRRLDGTSIQPATSGALLAEAFGGAAPERGRADGVLDLLSELVPGHQAQGR